MKNILCTIFLFGTSLLYAQQSLDLSKPLPEDPEVSKGVLDNGMTYYVRSNDEPQNRAE